ncbi:diguanylate cyclase, partial [bacterium]|nr:diguanylate cyclase [bacterium]
MFTPRKPRKKKNISDLISFIIRDPKHYSFEETVFNVFAFLAFIVSVLLSFTLPIVGLKFFHVFLVNLLGIITFILYYLSRFKHKTHPEVLIILLNIFLSILWFTGVGSNGFAGLFFIAGIILSVTLLKGVKRNIFFSLSPVIVMVLVGLEYYHPEWVGTYSTLTEKYVDYLLNVILLLLAVGFFIKILVDNIRERGEQLEEANRKLQKSAYYDQLTAVPNRRLFYENLNHTLNLAKRNEQKFALLYLDLDNFKEINDKLGHDKGDIFLRNAAKTISGCLRKSDILARMGGDEFVIILPEIESEKDISIVAQKIIDEISTGYDLERYDASIGVSIGISIFHNDNIGAGDLVKQADEA